MRYVAAIAALGLLLAVTGTAGATYYVSDGFETVWTGDYAPGWVNMEYRHGDPPIGQMMQQTAIAHSGTYGMKLIADSVPQSWMWFAGVDPESVSAVAMQKQYDPWISAWYYDEGPATPRAAAGQITAVPSWVNGYTGDAGDEDWTDIQFGARFNVQDDYYFVAVGENHPGWQDTGVARPTETEEPRWVQLKMQLSSADGKVHFYVNGTEVGQSYRADYIDLGSEIGLYTMFTDPLSDWGSDKPYTIWDDFEYGSSIPEPVTMAGLMLGIGALGGYVRRRRKA